MSRKGPDNRDIDIEDYKLEQVESFEYLDSNINSQSKTLLEIDAAKVNCPIWF